MLQAPTPPTARHKTLLATHCPSHSGISASLPNVCALPSQMSMVVLPSTSPLAGTPSASSFSLFMYPHNAVAVILRPFSAKIRTSILSVYPLFRQRIQFRKYRPYDPAKHVRSASRWGSFAFSLRNARSSRHCATRVPAPCDEPHHHTQARYVIYTSDVNTCMIIVMKNG